MKRREEAVKNRTLPLNKTNFEKRKGENKGLGQQVKNLQKKPVKFRAAKIKKQRDD